VSSSPPALAESPRLLHHLWQDGRSVDARQIRSRGAANRRDRRTGMPTYVFRCAACNHKFEKVMTVAQREKAKPVCPKCKGRKTVPVLTGFSAKTSRKS
jgi:putative FmdB family regulatory protein